MNKIYSKIHYYTLLFISHPLLLYILYIIISLLSFTYLQDPVLCQGLGEAGDPSASQEETYYSSASQEEEAKREKWQASEDAKRERWQREVAIDKQRRIIEEVKANRDASASQEEFSKRDPIMHQRLQELRGLSNPPRDITGNSSTTHSSQEEVQQAQQVATASVPHASHTSHASQEEKLNALSVLYNSDKDKHDSACKKYEYWNHLYLESRKRPLRNAGFEEQSYNPILHHIEELKHYIKKIRITEEGIKKVDPNYVSLTPRQWYE